MENTKVIQIQINGTTKSYFAPKYLEVSDDLHFHSIINSYLQHGVRTPWVNLFNFAHQNDWQLFRKKQYPDKAKHWESLIHERIFLFFLLWEKPTQIYNLLIFCVILHIRILTSNVINLPISIFLYIYFWISVSKCFWETWSVPKTETYLVKAKSEERQHAQWTMQRYGN